MFSPCSCGLSQGAPVSPTIKTCVLGVSLVSILTKVLAQNLELNAWVKCRDQISLYTVYVTNKVPLPNVITLFLVLRVRQVFMNTSHTKVSHLTPQKKSNPSYRTSLSQHSFTLLKVLVKR